MLAARPVVPPPRRRPRSATRPARSCELDRGIRDLQVDLDERQQRNDRVARARWRMASGSSTPSSRPICAEPDARAHVVAGLEIMATRAEIAVAAAEQGLRSAESDALVPRIARADCPARPRPHEDRARSGENRSQIRDLVVKNQRSWSCSASRSCASAPSAAAWPVSRMPAKSEMELAELRIMAAMIEEALLRLADQPVWHRARLADDLGGRHGHARDRLHRASAWRSGGAGPRETEEEIDEWVPAVQRIIANGLRTPASELPDERGGARAGELLDLHRHDHADHPAALGVADVRFGADVAVNLLAQSAGWRGWLRDPDPESRSAESRPRR